MSERQRLRRLCALVALCWLVTVPAGPLLARDLSVRVTDPQGRPQPNAVVTASWPGAPSPAANPPPATMIQRDMTFRPHVLAVPVHTSVVFPNHDQTRHHVYSFSNAKTFDIKLYVGFPDAPIVFDRTGVVALGCNIHDQMRAFIYVTDRPRFGVSGSDGRVRLTDLPEAPVTISVWHEWLSGSERGTERTVNAETTALDIPIDIAPPPAPARSEEPSLTERFRNRSR